MFFFSQGFTRRIVGVPKAESDAILTFLFHQISENPDHQVRFRWEVNSIAFWDNRVSNLLEHFFLKMKIYLLFIIRLSLIQLHSIFGLLRVMPFELHLMEKNQPRWKIMNVKQEKKPKTDSWRFGNSRVSP